MRPHFSLEICRFTSCLHHLLAGNTSIGIINHHLYLTWLVFYIVPAQAIAIQTLLRILLDTSLTLSIYKEFGLISYVIRLNDKMKRLKSLTKPGVEQEVKSESIEDTLMDLAAYAIMAIESVRTNE